MGAACLEDAGLRVEQDGVPQVDLIQPEYVHLQNIPVTNRVNVGGGGQCFGSGFIESGSGASMLG